jgi:hypothetical protein
VKQYRRKQKTTVTAVQIDLETEGFTYQKWGGEQRCKPGDWLVNNQGDTYTVDGTTFERTYRAVSPGVYEKVASVWAERASEPGSIGTKEGATAYQRGDWLVYNDAQRKDGYAMTAEKFESLYEEAGEK